jgi:hypothetical protein
MEASQIHVLGEQGTQSVSVTQRNDIPRGIVSAIRL